MKKLSLILFGLCAQAWADWAVLAPGQFRLPPPPAAGSVEEGNELNDLLYAQKHRSYQQCALGNWQTLPTYSILFESSAEGLTPAEHRAMAPVMRRVFELTTPLFNTFKDRYHRPRPYQTSNEISPCLIKPGYDDSYPSGHAALGAVGGCVLARKFPAKAEALKAQGYLVGELRFVGGVHHPSDIVAGHELAQQICDRLFADPEFKKDLAGVSETN